MESISCDRCGNPIELAPASDVDTQREITVGDYGVDEQENILCAVCIPIVRAEGTEVIY